jgi:putative membrane protein
MTLQSLGNAILFAAIGILLYGWALVILGRLLPGNLWKQALTDHNMAAAVILAAVALSLGWIVAAAVH